MIRLHILKTLLRKEVDRYLANRGALVLAFLLIVMALLLSVFGTGATTEATDANAESGQLISGLQTCIIDFEDSSRERPLIDYIRDRIPAELRGKVALRSMKVAPVNADGKIVYPTATGALQIRLTGRMVDGREVYRLQRWVPPGGRAVDLEPFIEWFLRESRRFYLMQANDDLATTDGAASMLPPSEAGPDRVSLLIESHESARRMTAEAYRKSGVQKPVPLPSLELDRTVEELSGAVLDTRSTIAMALVMFALFFCCVYLLPSLTCEERERGMLLAQALSPASPLEILAAKFLFFPALGVVLASLIAGVYNPKALLHPFWWCAVPTLAVGSQAIGMTIASIAQTQRAASMGALCYMLTVTSTLMIGRVVGIPMLKYAFIEHYGPRVIHAALANEVQRGNWIELLMIGILTLMWCGVAIHYFRKQGWQ